MSIMYTNTAGIMILLIWIMSTVNVQSEETEESFTEGNYTLVSSETGTKPGTSTGKVCLGLYGEKLESSSCYALNKGVNTCTKGKISITGIDYAGRICAIGLWIDKEGSCRLSNITLTDNISGDKAEFYIDNNITTVKRTYNRSESSNDSWSVWGQWAGCFRQSRTRNRRCEGRGPETCRHCKGAETETEHCSSQSTAIPKVDSESEDSDNTVIIPVLVSVFVIVVIIVVSIICYSRRVNKQKTLSKGEVSYDRSELNDQTRTSSLLPTDLSMNVSSSPNDQLGRRLVRYATPEIIVTCPSGDEADRDSAVSTGDEIDQNSLLTPMENEHNTELNTSRCPSGIEWEENDLYVSANC